MPSSKTVNYNQTVLTIKSGNVLNINSVDLDNDTLLNITSIDTEKRLFSLVCEGDEDAFRRLFHLYRPLFTAVIKKIVHNDVAFEDILQEVFLRIWLKRDMMGEVNNPRAWALQVVYHRSFNWLRHQNVYSKATDVATEQNATFSNIVEESVSFSDTSKILQRIIQKLPSQTQKIYRLNREQGLRITEIAQRMNLSPQTIKNTLGNAIKSIRKSLLQEGILLSLMVLYCLHIILHESLFMGIFFIL
ncbi:RNA polymerase sigma factor [Arachidicoccus soli]|uniref:RNA polymerase sigma-70 factor n=1 Tax=Arachidicoccus soli TaxID=2341117 RepID=A0A386HKM2_9BACT|nr:RNA polymerase sigma-70 factor [Arachidicoccus soli]AYD46448.1 RNA polymerase sigma-70 factor [Arachidicoccus soli]